MEDKPKINKRALLKYVHESGHKVIHETPESKAVGKRLLEQAKKAHEDRVADSDRRIMDYSLDVAVHIRNQARGTVFFVGGIGEGKSLGPGKWRYRPNEGWIKLGG